MQRFDERAAQLPNYTALPPTPVDWYMDYKHPNFRGRAFYTEQVANALIQGMDE